MDERRDDIVAGILLLYELSQAIGRSLDAKQTCREFLDVLMRRKRLASAGVWIAENPSRRRGRNVLKLLHGAPARLISQELSIKDLSIGHIFETGEPELAQFGSARFDELNCDKASKGGSIAMLPIGDFGILGIQSIQTNGISDLTLRQLRSIVQKFAVSLQGCLAHEQLLEEVEYRRNMQRDLEREKERAELSDRAKSQFLATTSHELRTPLNAIIGYSQLILEGIHGPLKPAKYRDYVEDVVMAGEMLNKVLSDILDISRIESDNMDINEEHVDVGETVAAAVRIMANKAAAFKISLGTSVDKELPGLLADERRLKQILVNLLSNAIKFSDAGTTIEIKAYSRPGGGISMAVVDQGIGIKATDIERIFRPFEQADNSFTRKHDGVGLGLSLCRRMAEQHNGELILESTFGEGTTATLHMPEKRTIESGPQ